MLTPSFDIQQNDEFVILKIRVPYIKISDAEFHINGQEFKFYCKPYFLRLHLPGELIEDGRENASYDIESGTIVVHLPKCNCGEHFENLGMLTTLLSKTPVKAPSQLASKTLIEVVRENSPDSSDATAIEEEEFDWQIEQQLPQEEQLLGAPSYGFASQHKGVLSKLQEEIPSIVDCPQPDHMTSCERRLARIAHEEASFDPGYYLADLMDNDQIEDLIKYQPPWSQELERWRTQHSNASDTAASIKAMPIEPGQDVVSFSAEERDHLKELPNKEYLLDKATKRTLYLGLVDIIFAFAYNFRTTLGESNVESAWTICKLSSTLSWLEVFRGSVHEVVYCSLRHTLCYPHYRHWQLALAVLQDTRNLFHLGRRKILQSLLSIYNILKSSDTYYIMNTLYIADYCIWIQRASSKQIQNLATELDEVAVDISSIGWDLLELEQAAHLVLAEEKECGESSATSSDSPKHALENYTSSHHDNVSANPTDHVQPHVAPEIANIQKLSSGLEQVLVLNHSSCHIKTCNPLIEELPPKETQAVRSSTSSSNDTEDSCTDTSGNTS